MRKTYGILEGNIHYWKSQPKQWLLSFEDTKTLLSFKDIDSMVNYLYLNDLKGQARQLNKESK